MSATNTIEFIAKLFEQNEEAPATRKLTDGQIRETLLATFPGKKWLRDIANVRSLYRRGHFTQGRKRKSTRFDETGKKAKKFARNP